MAGRENHWNRITEHLFKCKISDSEIEDTSQRFKYGHRSSSLFGMIGRYSFKQANWAQWITMFKRHICAIKFGVRGRQYWEYTNSCTDED